MLAGAFGLYDHAYYWPHFTPITEAVEYGPGDIACFTLSKLTGHAGQSIQQLTLLQTYITNMHCHAGPCTKQVVGLRAQTVFSCVRDSVTLTPHQHLHF